MITGNGLGIRVVGGKEIPGSSGEIGAYIAKILPGGNAEQTGKLIEGKINALLKMDPWDYWEFATNIYYTHFLLCNGCNPVQGMRAKPPRCLQQKRPDSDFVTSTAKERCHNEHYYIFSNMCQHALCTVTYHQNISWAWFLKIFNLS